MARPRTLDELLEGHAPAPTITAAEVAQAHRDSNGPTLIVLDDDPTGTQSVADLPVITSWDTADLRWALDQGAPAIYVMTNSRSLAPDDAARVNREVVAAATAAAQETGTALAFVSRSDSTLRGHFPLEPDVLAEASPTPIDGVIIVPAFGDAGRITIDAIHYAGNQADGFIPVGESEFARDSTFGYTSSDLREWVAEKTHGAVPITRVAHVDLDTLRTDTQATTAILAQATDRQPIVCDIVTEEDLRALALAVIAAEEQGKHFIYRVGPPFVRARIGQEPPAVVTAPPASAEPPASQAPQAQADAPADSARPATRGGLVVVGSHVPTTTRQLSHLVDTAQPLTVEINARRVLDGEPGYLDTLAQQVCAGLEQTTVVLHTSRELIEGSDEQDSLRIARDISAAVVGVVNRTVHTVAPRFVIAKGGITSSDVASKGLEMTRARVIGPMEPGIISMWQALDGPAAGVPYIVFAGNVGTDESLAHVVSVLS